MNIIESKFEILEQSNDLEGVLKQIELAGRNCYKSESKITETSYKEFVERMVNSKHYAMLEHGTLYLQKQLKFIEDYICDVTYLRYVKNPYSKVYIDESEGLIFITTNYRVIVENGWYEDLQYICSTPNEQHEQRITVKFTTSQGIMRELTRHRKFSFAVESTRYCNYNSEKFNKELTFIKPYWFKNEYIKDISDIEDVLYTKDEFLFVESLIYTENLYNELIEGGCKPQEAREILPLSTKCDVIMTGFVSDWTYFFTLRSSLAKTGKPHPDMVKLIDPLMEEFYKRKYIE